MNSNGIKSSSLSSSLVEPITSSSSMQQSSGGGNSNSNMEIDENHVDHKPSYHWEKQYGMFISSYSCLCVVVCIC